MNQGTCWSQSDPGDKEFGRARSLGLLMLYLPLSPPFSIPACFVSSFPVCAIAFACYSSYLVNQTQPLILASLLICYGAAMSNVSAGPCQDPNSSLTNDSDGDADDDTDDDDDDDDGGGDDGQVAYYRQ